jgi:hypothetical protein
MDAQNQQLFWPDLAGGPGLLHTQMNKDRESLGKPGTNFPQQDYDPDRPRVPQNLLRCSSKFDF